MNKLSKFRLQLLTFILPPAQIIFALFEKPTNRNNAVCSNYIAGEKRRALIIESFENISVSMN